MRIRNVHSRDLPVGIDRVGALLDGLGGSSDRLFPSERWPTGLLVLDGPLAVGTTGHQGMFELTRMRQQVDEYEPGRRLVFRFAPGLGVVGTHRFEVQPLGAGRTRLLHTFDCRVQPKMLPAYPIFIRQHDALVEDLLDRAELAVTGRVARPSHWPLSVRVANAIEVRIARWRGLLPAPESIRSDALARACGVAVPSALLAVAALHAAWACGWYWPASSERELAEYVLSRAERERLDGLPPASLTWLVALGLACAAGVVRALAAGSRSRALRSAGWGVAGIFLVRGLVYLPLDVIGGLGDRYDRLDLTVYSPLCLVLAAGAALVLRGTPGVDDVRVIATGLGVSGPRT